MAELSCHASMIRPVRTVSAGEELLKGLWRENPVLSHALGLCPTLAVTNSVANGIVMGLATGFVLVVSSALVSSLKRLVPVQIRITSYILIIATFVSVAELIVQATVPDIYKGGPDAVGRVERGRRNETEEIVMMPWGGMMGWGSGLGMGVGWLMGVLFLGLLVGAGVLVVRALSDRDDRTGGRRESEDTSLAILRERYARGEIEQDEFETKKRDLQRR